MTKTVRDNALLYGIISGRDDCDSTTVDVPPVELPDARGPEGSARRRPEGAERGRGDRARRHGGRAPRDRSLRRARRRRRRVRAAALGRVRAACYYLIAPAEASSNLARYDGVRYGLRVPADNYYEMVARTRDAGFGDEPKRRIMLGTYALSAGYYEAYYGQAQKVRTVISREFADAFERFDVLVSPTSPTVAFKHRREGGEPARDVPRRRAHDPAEHGRAAGPVDSMRALGRASGRAAADRRRSSSENTLFRAGHALEQRDRFRHRPGAVAMKTIVDRAADFVLAVERVFGVRPRVLDGSRAYRSTTCGSRSRPGSASSASSACTARSRSTSRSSRFAATSRCRCSRRRSSSMPEWEPVIGLEIHVQLKTRTKMFCGCEPGFGGEPNTRTCPVCLAFPGALPVPNETAVEWTIKLGHALNCRIAEHAVFHRKNYFYPDNPEGVPDLPVRRAALHRRLLRRARARRGQRGRHRARASRGGRGEDDPRRRRYRAASSARRTRTSTSTAAARRSSRS